MPPFRSSDLLRGSSRRGALVWAVIALAMYASRRKELRRAALRGGLAAVVGGMASLLPPWRGDPAEQAAAAGFVTGAALEAPVAGIPLAGLGAALYVPGATDPGRSLGAVALGAAAGLASTRVWPVPPREGAEVRRVSVPADAEPSPDGDGLTIVVNADSGPAVGESATEDLRKALPGAKVVEVEIESGDEIRKALDAAAADGAEALGICGGDGSINTAAQVALEAGKPLLIVPGGTFNHLTQALGIETAAEAVEALRAGCAVSMDVATIGGHVFLNTASFGSYVELVDARERLEKRIGKWPAVVVALIRVLRHSDPVEVEIDGKPQRVWMAFIGNCSYHPSGFAPTWRERLDDGKLDFRYVGGDEPWARTRLIAAVLTGRLGRSKVYHQGRVDRLSLRALDGSLRLARDGETFEAPEEVKIEKLDKKLVVFAPHSEE